MAKKFLPNETTDLVSVLRSVVVGLNKQPDVGRGGLYHTLPGAMNDRVSAMGVVNVAHFILLMQELGLLRKWGGGSAVVWQVVCITFFDEIVTPMWLERAQACLAKHIETTDTLRSLREQVAAAEDERTARDENPVGAKSIEEIADMVVTIERLEAALAERDTEVATLKQKLEERPKFDADAALAAAIKRARERMA